MFVDLDMNTLQSHINNTRLLNSEILSYRYHSFNTQIVCDAFYKIRDVVSGVPGSVHDASIWADSSLLSGIVSGQILSDEPMEINSYLLKPYILGDAAYPTREYCVTPYKQSAATT